MQSTTLQATFYPIEARRKGATATQFGAVFGIIHLSLFIFGEESKLISLKVFLVFKRFFQAIFMADFVSCLGPLVGKYLSIWGVKAIFPAGFIIDGGTFILFGLLQWVNHTTAFLVFSYLIRFLEVSICIYW